MYFITGGKFLTDSAPNTMIVVGTVRRPSIQDWRLGGGN